MSECAGFLGFAGEATSVVIPVFNEQASLPELIDRCLGACRVFLNKNYGQHSAVMAGLAAARGTFVVTLDADLQNPPEEIPRVRSALGKEAVP
jgi:undecaprenyl-phosphate 4-deoxy-4-formamido-L-arabinose transferase